jgi:hypothetical protein
MLLAKQKLIGDEFIHRSAGNIPLRAVANLNLQETGQRKPVLVGEHPVVVAVLDPAVLRVVDADRYGKLGVASGKIVAPIYEGGNDAMLNFSCDHGVLVFCLKKFNMC